MKIQNLKPGDRIEDAYLGRGTLLEKHKGLGWWLVRWDKNPPLYYNMCQNPSLEPLDNYKLLTDEEEARNDA